MLAFFWNVGRDAAGPILWETLWCADGCGPILLGRRTDECVRPYTSIVGRPYRMRAWPAAALRERAFFVLISVRRPSFSA